MNKSEQINELATALAKAQGQIEGASKDKTNPHFRSKYADLSSVVEAIQKPLSAHGLSFIQVSHDSDDCAKVETLILHASGQWISAGAVSVPVSKRDAQGYGSALTYARRYSLSAAFGVAPEDDDGNAAAKAAPAAQQPQQTSITPTSGAWEAMDMDQQRGLQDIADRARAKLMAGDDIGSYELIQAEKLTQEEMTALWTRLDSKERAALKKAAPMAKKPQP